MSTPVSSEQIRDRYAERDAAHRGDRFAVWAWSAWVVGIVPWLIVFYYAYPVLWGLSHGKLTPSAPGMWVLRGLYFLFVFIAVPAFALYASSIFFVVLRVAGERLTVGRWFGARSRVYGASEVGAWHLSDGHSRRVADARAASMVSIDFLDGSFVSMPRRAWNFRALVEWLRRWDTSAGGVDMHASNGAPTTYRFVVQRPGVGFFVLAAWVMGWMVGGLSIARTLSGPLGPHVGLHGVAWYALGLVMLGLMPLLAGPLCVHFLLREVRVDAPHIQIDRWFGLIRRTYHENDIESWHLSVDSEPPQGRHARDSSLLLRFADGRSVFVRERATNFRHLHEYLRDRAGSREDVPRSVKAAGTGS